MSTTINQDGSSTTVGKRKIDVGRGQMNGAVSTQWFNRPSDQRFLSMDALIASLQVRGMGMREDMVEGKDIRIITLPDRPNSLNMVGPDEYPVSPTNIAFQQMCGLVGAPYSYLRGLPAHLAGINIQYGFADKRDLGQKLYWNEISREVRAFTGENYGRVMDLELAEAVHKLVGNGTGDTCWKVPGVIDWSTMNYNPFVDVTSQTTTLFASDRDVFMFLCDDTHPIEIGKLKDGSPDLVFRGFYAWNSEVGTRSIGTATFLMRGSCANRCLWGVQDFEEMRIRHTRFAPGRFARDMAPALHRYANAGTGPILAGIKAAKSALVARTEDDAKEWLGARKFTKSQIEAVLEVSEREEGHTPTSAWDFVQGITAVARNLPNTDVRLDMERRAGDIMTKAARVR